MKNYVTWKGINSMHWDNMKCSCIQGRTNYNSVESCYLYDILGSTTQHHSIYLSNTSTANKANYK
jgi:hypothetical protein